MDAREAETINFVYWVLEKFRCLYFCNMTLITQILTEKNKNNVITKIGVFRDTFQFSTFKMYVGTRIPVVENILFNSHSQEKDWALF